MWGILAPKLVQIAGVAADYLVSNTSILTALEAKQSITQIAET